MRGGGVLVGSFRFSTGCCSPVRACSVCCSVPWRPQQPHQGSERLSGQPVCSDSGLLQEELCKSVVCRPGTGVLPRLLHRKVWPLTVKPLLVPPADPSRVYEAASRLSELRAEERRAASWRRRLLGRPGLPEAADKLHGRHREPRLLLPPTAATGETACSLPVRPVSTGLCALVRPVYDKHGQHSFGMLLLHVIGVQHFFCLSSTHLYYKAILNDKVPLEKSRYQKRS